MDPHQASDSPAVVLRGDLLRALREEIGWRQHDVSRLSNTGISTIRRWETPGELPHAGKLNNLCALLSITPNDVLEQRELPGLRELRFLASSSISDVAQATELSRFQISKFETGDVVPSIEEMYLLHRTYRVPIVDVALATERTLRKASGTRRFRAGDIIRERGALSPCTDPVGTLMQYARLPRQRAMTATQLATRAEVSPEIIDDLRFNPEVDPPVSVVHAIAAVFCVSLAAIIGDSPHEITRIVQAHHMLEDPNLLVWDHLDQRRFRKARGEPG